MKVPTDRKMTFTEFVAWSEDLDDNNIDDTWLKHWEEFLPKFLTNDYSKEHCGDCTNVACPCTLCVLENWLVEYREYFFEKQGGTKR